MYYMYHILPLLVVDDWKLMMPPVFFGVFYHPEDRKSSWQSSTGTANSPGIEVKVGISTCISTRNQLPSGNFLHSYWKWPFMSWIFPWKMAMFNSYFDITRGWYRPGKSGHRSGHRDGQRWGLVRHTCHSIWVNYNDLTVLPHWNDG